MIAQYVDEQALKQIVLIMGGTVAAESYGVTNYPTSFLIDRKGVVVQHDVGFNEEMADKLEEEIVDLLAKQKGS